MADGDIGKRCEAMSTRLGHGIRGNTLLLRLHLGVVLIRWMSQLETRKRNVLLKTFKIGKIKTVRGIQTHGRLGTRTITNRYNCVEMKKVKQDLRKWFNQIASHRIHTNSRLAILKAW